MASREREHSTAVAAAAKPAETRDSAFRRGAGDFAERQIPGPRRFGFASSPPRRHTSSSGGSSSMMYDRPSPPRGHHDTSRHSTILPRSSSSSSRLTAMPIGLRGLSNDVRVGAGIADVIRSQQDVAVEEQQHQLQLLQQQRLLQQLQETQPQQPQHPAFSQLALVLGFELAKKVTQKHPRETDMNRLANLALDITAGPPAAPAVEAVTTPPSRSASTTSATSTPSESRRRSTAFTVSSRNSNHGGNRSPTYGGRPFGSGGRSAPLARSRTNSTPSSITAGAPAAAADAFVTAVSAAGLGNNTATTAVSPPRPALSSVVPSPTAPSSPPPVFGDEDDAGYDASDLRTDATAPDDTASAEDEDDLIDFDGEAAEQAHHSSAPLIVESSHLLD